MSVPLSTYYYALSRHAVQRFAAAHALDPISGILRAHEDLAISREVSLAEARLFLGAGLRWRDGRTYRAGMTGIYVCAGNQIVTYIDRAKPAPVKGLRLSLRRLRRRSR